MDVRLVLSISQFKLQKTSCNENVHALLQNPTSPLHLKVLDLHSLTQRLTEQLRKLNQEKEKAWALRRQVFD